MYLTLDEYKAFGGAEMNAATFERYEFAARKFLDDCTSGRIKNETPTRECVKRAMFELIARRVALSAMGEDAKQIASVSNDGVSISYVNNGNGGGLSSGADVATVRIYLSGETDADGVPLLYRGVVR